MAQQVAVERIDGKKAAPESFVDEIQALSDRIRRRAFDLFERRGGVDGFAVDDWLNAEQDLLLRPQSELVEKDGTFKLRISATGFGPGDVKVIAQPEALIVKASASHNHEKKEENVHFCEFDEKTLYRRFDLPHRIAIDNVTASLDNGILELLAPKTTEEPVKVQPMPAKAKAPAAA